jgi:small conductance mechanosensitive channel
VGKLATILIGKITRQSKPLVAAQARRTTWVVVWIIGAILAIEQLAINSTVLLLVLALLGVGALIAFSLPLQNIGAKYFSDIYLPFKVGDSITVGNYSGKVVEINSMSTILLTDNDQLVSVPNALFARRVVVNATPQAWREVSIPLEVGGQIDLPSFENAVLKSLGKLKLHLDKRFPPILTTRNRGPDFTELTLTVMIRRPEEREAIVNEINKRVSQVMETLQTQK